MISFDGAGKIISLDSSTIVSITDIYSRWVDWLIVDDNLKYAQAMNVLAQPPVVPTYVTLINDWKIKPFAGSYSLTLNDGFIYTSDSSDPFVASGGAEPRIIWQNPVIAVGYATGSGVLPTDITAIAAEVKIRMEEAGSKLTKAEQKSRLIPACLK